MKKPVPEVLFYDDDIIVVDKPSGIPVIPERFAKTVSLQEMLGNEFEEVFVVHRIDKGTSGLICFARNAAAHRHLSMQFQEHTVKKFYTAFVKGKLAEKSGTIDAPIAENELHPGRMLVHQRGKQAITLYEVMEEFKHASILKVEIKTGRTHQIRVHMAYIGHPLLVDDVYAKVKGFFLSSVKKKYKLTDEEERPIIDRLTLHASSLSFLHPSSNEQVTFETPLPKDLEALAKLLRKYD
jgi:23S rRNA pseudouridine955/2504/2580 synthase/23S rRNA pseudouridine1911/1915/1917 synthase